MSFHRKAVLSRRSKTRNKSRKNRSARYSSIESLEARLMLRSPWSNAFNRFEVNDDGTIAPGDVLIIVNEINSNGSRRLPDLSPGERPPRFFDVNCDHFVTPGDVLAIINQLNKGDASELFSLIDGNTFISETARSIALGQEAGTRTISFDVRTQFDRSDSVSISEDTFAVYLVDAQDAGETLIDGGGPGAPVFSLQGDRARFEPGLVRYDGSRVQIDVSELADETEGKLLFQLINTDNDQDTRVVVESIKSDIDPNGEAQPRFPSRGLAATAGGAIDTASLEIAATLTARLEDLQFDRVAGVLAGTLFVSNEGPNAGRQVAVFFPGLPAEVQLLDSSGTDASGDPFINVSTAIPNGGLRTGTSSSGIPIRFANPNETRFALTASVLAGSPNRPPAMDPISALELTAGDQFVVPLIATDPDGDSVTFSVAADQRAPHFTLTSDDLLVLKPTPAQIGGFQFEVTATDGAESTARTIEVAVLADPATTTRVSGVVQDIAEQPIAGVPIEIRDFTAVTVDDGSFTIDLGDTRLTADDVMRIDGLSAPTAEVFPTITEPIRLLLGRPAFDGANNVIARPIFLPSLDIANSVTIDPLRDTIATTASIPGLSLTIPAGAAVDDQGNPFAGEISITEVPRDRTPAALPSNASPDLVITVQPGELVFNQPAPATFPNRTGLAPGTELDLFSISHETGEFEVVGKSRVSDDGSVIAPTEGGIRNSSWHFTIPTLNAFVADPSVPAQGGGNQAPPGGGGGANSDTSGNEWMQKATTTSRVEMHSGVMTESHQTVAYESLGVQRGISLVYDSLRADPRHIIHRTFAALSNDNPATRILGSLTARRGGGDDPNAFTLAGDQHFWRVPPGTNDLDIALQFDFSDQPSGEYELTLTSGVQLPLGDEFVGSTRDVAMAVLNVNYIDSVFGAGWGVAGLKQAVTNPNGNVLLIDGDGSEMLFTAADNPSDPFISPATDFSVLKRMPDGRLRRTDKDQTVEEFNLNGTLASIVDRNGNLTRFEYDSQSNLLRILDPVNLITEFRYDGGRVSQIQDPAGRITELAYDDVGNLIRVTDPDGTSRQFEYDSFSHQVAETDKRGNTETSEFDFAGRVVGAVRKDGTAVNIAALQTRGLLPADSTRDPVDSPFAFVLSAATPDALAADGNGNVTQSSLDQRGQAVRVVDAVGSLVVVNRDSQNLVSSITDGRGNRTDYTYDDQGNVIRERDAIARAALATNVSLFETPLFPMAGPDGREPQSAALADLNNDEIPDVITTGFGAVSVRLGLGNGSFGDRLDFAGGLGNALTVVDIDGDRNIDVATANSGGTVSVHLGKGDGSFEDAVTIGGSLDANSIVSGDFNGDDEIDLIVGFVERANNAELYLGRGDGTFAAPVTFDAGGNFNVIETADLDADGDLDLAITHERANSFSKDDRISILLSNGDGTFAAPVDLLIGDGPRDLSIDDVTGDGNLDIVAIEEFPTVSVLPGAGDGTFGEAQTFLASNGFIQAVETADVNGDGNVDILLAVNESSGDGIVAAVNGGNGDFSTLVKFNTGQLPIAVAASDLNSDEITDFVALNIDFGALRDANVSVSLGQADGGIESPQQLVTSFVGGQFLGNLDAGDVNGDGLSDIVTGTNRSRFARGSVSLLLATGPGTFSQNTQLDVGEEPRHVRLLDANGDRKLDIVTANFDSADLSLLVGDGDGNFQAAQSIDAGAGAADVLETFSFADLDDNGTIDLVVPKNNLLGIISGNGDGTFATSVDIAVTAGSRAPAVADLDGDGDLDIVLPNSQNIAVLMGDGQLGFTPGASVPIANGDDVDLFDVNSDTFLDLIVTADESVAVALGAGDGTFAAADTIRLQGTRHTLDMGDVDLDGNVDIAVSNPDTDSIMILFGDGDGSFGDAELFFGGSQPLSVELVDLTSDGQLDFVAANFGGFGNASFVTVNTNSKSDGFDCGNGPCAKLFTYDPIFNERTSFTNEFGRVALFDVDPASGNTRSTRRVVGQIDSAQNGEDDDIVRHFTYTATGQVETETDPLGRISRNEYDEMGRLTRSVVAEATADEEETRFEYDLAGNLVAAIDALGNRTEFEYDVMDRLIVERDALANESRFAYDEAGNLISIVDANGNQTQFKYDSRDRLTMETDSLGNTTQTFYDQEGNVSLLIDPLGREARFQYDARNRLVATIDAGGGRSETRFDADNNVVAETDELGRQTTFAYDARGRLIETTDALGNKLRSVFDPVDNLVQSIDTLGRATASEYDELNRLVTQIDPAGGETLIEYDKNDSTVAVEDELGRRITFEHDDQDRLVAAIDALGGRSVTQYDPVGNPMAETDELGRVTRFEYDELSRLVASVDALGNRTTLAYDTVGNLTNRTDAMNRTTVLEYDELNRLVATVDALNGRATTTFDAVGNIVEQTDELGRTTLFQYDALDQLVRRTDPLGGTLTFEFDAVGNTLSTTDELGRTTTLTYDALNRLTASTDPLGGITLIGYDSESNRLSETDELGRVTRYEYDNLDRLVASIDPLEQRIALGYDAVGNLTTRTDELGRSTLFEYDAVNRPVKTTDALGGEAVSVFDAVGNLVSATDQIGRTTRFEYDDLDRLMSQTDPAGGVSSAAYDAIGNIINQRDQLARTTLFAYDQLDRLTGTTDPVGNVATTEYDAVGNVVRTTDRLNRETVLEYDELDRVIRQTDPAGNTRSLAYDAVGNRVARTDKLGRETRFGYDGLNRLVQVTDAMDGQTTFSYDAVGNRLTETDPLARTTSFEYDGVNRVVTASDPLGNRQTIQFDAVGNILSETNGRGETTVHEFDALDRRTRSVDALGNSSTIEYDAAGQLLAVIDPLGRRVENDNDLLGNVISRTDSLGNSTTREYDAVSNLVATADPNGNRTTFEFDALDRRVRQTDALGAITTTEYDAEGNLTALTDAAGNRTAFVYDALNRQISETNSLGLTRTFAYDAEGNLTSRTDRADRTMRFDYDALNRLVKETWVDAAGEELRVFDRTYDAIGQLIAATDPDSAYQFAYSGAGELLSTDNSQTPNVPATVVRYSYDANSNVTQVADTVNGLDLGTTTYQYNPLDQVVQVAQSGNGVAEKRVDYTFNAAQQRETIVRFSDLNGSVLIAETSYAYDGAGRLTQLRHQRDGTVFNQYDFTLDNAGRVTSIDSADGQANIGYDDVNQLTSSTFSFQENEQFSYDEVGNRTTAGFVTGANNRLQEDSEFTYEYDNEGNRVRQTERATGVVTEFTYDFRNRLISVRHVDASGVVSLTANYTYDFLDRRIGKAVDPDGDGPEPTAGSTFVYDGLQILLQFDDAGNLHRRVLSGTLIDEILAEEIPNGEMFWSLGDQIHTVRDVLDGSGDLVNHLTYDSFGQITSETNPDAVDHLFSFSGRELDDETGLTFLRSRYYDPAAGRFVSEDSIGFDGGDQNLYRYANNDPIDVTDPEGTRPRRRATDRSLSGKQRSETFAEGLTDIVKGGFGLLSFGLFSDPVQSVGQVVQGVSDVVDATVGTRGAFDDVAQVVDVAAAGIADGVTFGLTTDLRNEFFGDLKLVENSHNSAAFENISLIAGVASLAIPGGQAKLIAALGKAGKASANLGKLIVQAERAGNLKKARILLQAKARIDRGAAIQKAFINFNRAIEAIGFFKVGQHLAVAGQKVLDGHDPVDSVAGGIQLGAEGLFLALSGKNGVKFVKDLKQQGNKIDKVRNQIRKNNLGKARQDLENRRQRATNEFIERHKAASNQALKEAAERNRAIEKGQQLAERQARQQGFANLADEDLFFAKEVELSKAFGGGRLISLSRESANKLGSAIIEAAQIPVSQRPSLGEINRILGGIKLPSKASKELVDSVKNLKEGRVNRSADDGFDSIFGGDGVGLAGF